MVWTEVNETASPKATRRAGKDEITWGATVTWSGPERAASRGAGQPKAARAARQSAPRNLKPAHGLLTLLFGLGQ